MEARDHPSPMALNDLADTGDFVSAQVVHNHDITHAQCGPKHLLDIGPKHVPICGPVHRQYHIESLKRQRANHRHVGPIVLRDRIK